MFNPQRDQTRDFAQTETSGDDWLDRLARFNLHFGRFVRDAAGVIFFAVALIFTCVSAAQGEAVVPLLAQLLDNRAKYAKEQGRKLSERELEIQQKLKTPVSVQFENSPLAKVIDHLGKLAGVKQNNPKLHAELQTALKG